eukprot:1626537-Rhodomonas_salina.1
MVWDVTKHPARAAQSTLRGHNAPITCLTLGDNGEILSGDRDGKLVLWDLGGGCETRRLTGHRGHVTSVTWLEGHVMLSGAQ